MAVAFKNKLLFDGHDWTFDLLQRSYDAVAELASDDLGLDTYMNQIEIISSEQMLDAYSSVGMPLMYNHWSFGKRFIHDEHLYRKGYSGLAYEIVINSNPCISYNMEENTMALHLLVMAHAAFGHNHFFKNNYLFKQWTDADGILEYLSFAKKYIARCEERYGIDAVEEILDACHAIMDHGVFRYKRPPKVNRDEAARRNEERERYQDQSFNDLWRTVPGSEPARPVPLDEDEVAGKGRAMRLPEENILYFLEKNSPALNTWQREILRIVRTIAQYFYPQKQTKVMNEGCATFVHHHIANTLFDQGRIGEGALLEILQSHSNVVFQPDFDDPRYSGINPYALGFAMMQDLQRICVSPTAEDREWFPDFAGGGDWRVLLKDAWENYRDESFILQYLSPNLIRKFRLFALSDDSKAACYRVSAIHDDRGYRSIRRALARSYDLANAEPDIQVCDADMSESRRLKLVHFLHDGILLEGAQRDEVLKQVARLWGYEVTLEGRDRESDKLVYQTKAG